MNTSYFYSIFLIVVLSISMSQDDVLQDDALPDDVLPEQSPEPIPEHESHRASFFSQMETMLAQQIDKCNYYARIFKEQDNLTMATRFETYSQTTSSCLEILKTSSRNNESVPMHRFETITLSCMPVNIDIKERELQLVVKTSNLPVAKDAQLYIIAEFAFPQPRAETITGAIERWVHSAKIEPRNLLCCSDSGPRQLDIIYSTNEVPFTDPKSKLTEYSRALTFFVDKGKSRTLKRKFNPVKLTFYEKRGLFRCDKKLGFIQVRVEGINDENILKTRQQIMDGRKQTEAIAEVKVRVREPLVDKSIRAHEEKLLILT